MIKELTNITGWLSTVFLLNVVFVADRHCSMAWSFFHIPILTLTLPLLFNYPAILLSHATLRSQLTINRLYLLTHKLCWNVILDVNTFVCHTDCSPIFAVFFFRIDTYYYLMVACNIYNSLFTIKIVLKSSTSLLFETITSFPIPPSPFTNYMKFYSSLTNRF